MISICATCVAQRIRQSLPAQPAAMSAPKIWCDVAFNGLFPLGRSITRCILALKAIACLRVRGCRFVL